MKEYTKAKEIIESLRTIPDYRVDIGKIKHLLVEVLFTVIFTLLKGNTKFKEIYGLFHPKCQDSFLKKIIPFPLCYSL